MHAYRTHTCGQLRDTDVDSQVRLSGWVSRSRNHGGVLFVDLRDEHGLTQVVFVPESVVHEQAARLTAESVISVTGPVVARSAGNVNASLATGRIELLAARLEILSVAEALPFPVAEETPVSESLRLQHRFLDLRRQGLHSRIRLRSEVVASIRRRMHETGFAEIQTPILTSRSPEGARDFLVPSRLHPGQFYALPQSPQQFKQLLMIAGFDRYFQIASCFRDEDARADRSPGEHTQLDIEMAFVEQEDVFAVLEELLYGLFSEFSDWEVTRPPFPRIPYAESLSRFGTDKPDLRFGLEMTDLSDLFADGEFRLFQRIVDSGGDVRALVVRQGARQPRSFFAQLESWATSRGAAGISWLMRTAEGFGGSIAGALGREMSDRIVAATGAGEGDAILLLAGPPAETCNLGGELRLHLADELGLRQEGVFRFCWIVDFPMYAQDPETGAIDFCHNPFSMPQGGLQALAEQDPLEIVAYQYDIVVNGTELSSGAIRNHRQDIMLKAFEVAGYSPERVQAGFGGLLRAFACGAPPHGGIAPGIDRLVMLLAQEPNIREVIPFPMNQNAQDLLMGAPGGIESHQLRELGIRVRQQG
jgi:aspartyl-tRNA synthetase